MITATAFTVRDLTATEPDSYPSQEFDVLATCSDGTTRHSDATHSTRDEAEIAAAGYELTCDDLEQWTVCLAPQ